MFKKVLCCIMIGVLLCAEIPTTAFAGESSNALQTLRDAHYIDQLCATGGDQTAADWHAGMKLSDAASSLQMETELERMLYEDILPTLDYLEETITAQVAGRDLSATGDRAVDAADDLAGELRKKRDECRKLRDEVQAELDIIQYERSTLPDSVDAVFDGTTYLTENQMESAAQRALLGVERLENSMDVVSDSYVSWNEKLKSLQKLMRADDQAADGPQDQLTPLQSHIVNVRTDYMSAMMEESRRITGEERRFSAQDTLSDNEVEIYAVPRHKLLFDVRDEKNNPITGAAVTAWNAKTVKKYNGSYDKASQGYLFSTVTLGLEEDGYLEIGWEIKKNGYETQYVNSHLCEGGTIFRVVLKKCGNGSYISGSSFNGVDMQWNQTDIYITDANDAKQTISVYLDAASGTPSGTVAMSYTDRQGKTQNRTVVAKKGSDGRFRADFTDVWCKSLKPGAPVSFSVQGTQGSSKSLLTANEPACTKAGANKPRVETNNAKLLKSFLPSGTGLSVSAPENIPIFGGSSISFGFPTDTLPVTFFLGLDGSFLFLVTKSNQFVNKIKDYTEGSGWKNVPQAETKRQLNNAAKKVGEEIKSAKSDFAKDNKSSEKPFLGRVKAFWSLYFCAQGNYHGFGNNSSLDFKGQVSAGFNIGVNASFSKPIPAPVPLTVGVGVSVAVGAMINGTFSGTALDSMNIDFNKIDIEFRAVSIVIPISVYLSLGIGNNLAGAGLKGSVSLNLALPIITDNYKDNVMVAFDVRLTVYGQLILLHVNWLIARLGWTYENGRSGDVNGYVIGIGHLPKSAALPTWAKPEENDGYGGLYASNETGMDSMSLDVDSSTVWDYHPVADRLTGAGAVQNATTIPRNFELYSTDPVEMVIWAENNKIWISANSPDHPTELKIPDVSTDPKKKKQNEPVITAKAKITSGEYQIIDVNANSGDVHYDYVGSVRLPVQTAVVAVTYAKSFRKEKRTSDGKTVEVSVPAETGTLAMAIMLTPNTTKPMVLSTDAGDPAVYAFLNTDQAIREIYPYPCRLHVKKSNSTGLPCIDTANSFGVVTGALFEDGTLTSALYYYTSAGNGRYRQDNSNAHFQVLATGTTKDVPVYIGVDTGNDGIISGPLVNIARNLSYPKFMSAADAKNIDDFVIYEIPDTDGQMGVFYLEKTKEEGIDALKAVPMDLTDKRSDEDSVGLDEDWNLAVGGEVSPTNLIFEWVDKEKWDYKTDIPSTSLNMDHLESMPTLSPTLYWFDTGRKQIKASDEKQEIGRIRGVYFDWVRREASKPYTIATLYGNDGDTGGLTPNLAPLMSFRSGGQLYFARVLENENKEGEGDRMDWRSSPYMIYSANIADSVDLRVTGATAEYHAMSAGKSGNFTFTLLNAGNRPITSARMCVFRVVTKGGEEIEEPIAEYVLNPVDESQNKAYFWSADSIIPDERTGLAAVRQVDTVFNPLTGGSGTNEVRVLNSFLPGSVFTYKGTIAIPEDWDGQQTLRARVVRAFGPANASGTEMMYDLDKGDACLVDENGNVMDNAPLTANSTTILVEQSEPFDLVVDTAEISLSCNLYEKNGENYISAAISQSGNTAMNYSRGNIAIRAYVDDQTDYPAFVHTFKNHTTGDLSLNISAPVSTWTGGKKVDKLILAVSDAAEGNRDLSTLNNKQEFFLNEGLKWRVPPEDQTVVTGQTATFFAEAQDGLPPYSYKWFRSDSSQVFLGDTLVLVNCTDQMNGIKITCEATDAAGQKISKTVRLVVGRVQLPKTGDQDPLNLWIALFVIQLIVMLILFVRPKKRTYPKE